MIYHFIPTEDGNNSNNNNSSNKKQKITSVGEDVEKMKPSYITGGTVK